MALEKKTGITEEDFEAAIPGKTVFLDGNGTHWQVVGRYGERGDARLNLFGGASERFIGSCFFVNPWGIFDAWSCRINSLNHPSARVMTN